MPDPAAPQDRAAFRSALRKAAYDLPSVPAVTGLARIEIDLNVRIGADLTYSGFEDIDGAAAADLPRGTAVEVFERESGAHGPAEVAGRDFARKLIYLKVDWGKLVP